MLDFDVFITRYYPTANESKVNDITRFLNNVVSLLGDKPLEESLKNKTFLCKTFFLQKVGGSVSRPHYQKIKDYILNLLDYCGVQADIPSREDVLASQEVITFVKDLDALLDFIDSVGADKLNGYHPIKDLPYIKSIVILGWYGFDAQEIAEMPKNILSASMNEYYIINPYLPDKSRIEISARAYQIISYLENCSGYRTLPSGKVRNFCGFDEFMFRPLSKGAQAISADSIAQAIKRFNKEIPFTSDFAINFRTLKKNAYFVKVYEDKSDLTVTKKIMKHMGCSLKMAIGFNKQYYKWVELFHSN